MGDEQGIGLRCYVSFLSEQVALIVALRYSLLPGEMSFQKAVRGIGAHSFCLLLANRQLLFFPNAEAFQFIVEFWKLLKVFKVHALWSFYAQQSLIMGTSFQCGHESVALVQQKGRITTNFTTSPLSSLIFAGHAEHIVVSVGF